MKKATEFTLYRLKRPRLCPLFSLERPKAIPPDCELEEFKLRLTPKDVVDALNIFGMRYNGEQMVDSMVRSLNEGAIRDGFGPEPGEG